MMIEQLITTFFETESVYIQIARFLVTLALGILVTRAVLMPLSRKIVVSRGKDRKVSHSIENLVGLTALFISLVLALQAAAFGSLLTVIGTVAAALTVAIGFGMRDQVSNIVSGIFIHMDNPFVKHDFIKFNETEGVIKNIKLRHTELKGPKAEKTIVPNGLLGTNVVRNYSKGSKTRVLASFTVPVQKAEKASELLLDIVSENERVVEKPEPSVEYPSIDEGNAKLELNCWVKSSSQVEEVKTFVNKEFSSQASKKKIIEDKKED